MSKTMSKTMSKPDITRLPKWAQEHVADPQRERDIAVRNLRKWADDQTESPVSIMEMECIGEQEGPSLMMRYVHTNNLRIKWKGVELDIGLRDQGSMHDNCITLQWSSVERGMSHVAMVPTSFQSASLMSKEHMR